MTPNNIVNMAKLFSLDVIALTDHNSTGNCRAVIQAGEAVGLTVIAGMELCTAEEIHVVCLFPDIDAAEAFGEAVTSRRPPIKNKPHVFGEQVYMDAKDNVTGTEEILLITASDIGIDEVRGLVSGFGGFCYPAHVDRASFSVISSLGTFPADLGFTCAEISGGGDVEQLLAEHPALTHVRIMRSSDSHYLESMREGDDTIEVPACTPQAVLEALRLLKAD